MTTLSRILRRLSEGASAFGGRLRRDQRGAIAVQFALLAIPLSILVFALVDLGRISLQRRQMQDALDAATLMAARSTAVTDAELEAVGDPAFVAEVANLNMGLTKDNATFKNGAANHILGTATATLKPIISNLWTGADITVTANSDVVRSSKDLEVSLVLDITGSMGGTRITDLKTAASDLVDIIVKDTQSPFYSKVALVPYAAGVNVGSYADQARGAVPVRNVTGAAWANGSAVVINAVSKASKAVVTTKTAHGLVVGDNIYITGAKGMTQLSGAYAVTAVSNSTTFTLGAVNSTGYGTYTANSATMTKCLTASCGVVITTSIAHGFITGDQIRFAGMYGLTGLNGTTQTITKLTNTTFDTGATGLSGTYTSGGTATCAQSANLGCEQYVYTGSDNTYPVIRSLSSCTSERTGTQAYTDAAPSTAFLGTNYPSTKDDTTPSTNSANPCPTPTIMPLSSDKVALKAQIATLAAGGSTAGQIGLAWGWYMIAPNFNYLWPNDTQKAAAYKSKDLMKVVILMTDGAFNTPYCGGVIASNAGSGSGSNTDHINCTATNGDSISQAKLLCAAIKNSANDITLYTVGFDVGSDAAAKSFLTSCATDSTKVFFPATGSELKTAFKAIAQEISDLRIAK